MNINVFELLTYFIIYSVLGWIMESTVRTICEKKLINTGFLNGPCCPIYGIGAIIMLLFLGRFEDNPILLFLLSVIILTLWEYVVGVLLEKIFKTKYWDYSKQKFNFQGRICLVNSICWGILGLIFIKILHPFVQNVLSKVDESIIFYTIILFTIIFIIDTIISVVNVKNIKTTLKKIEEMNNEIKEKLKELRKLKLKKEKEQEKTTIESVQRLIEELKKKRNRTILRLYKNVYRLKKAFPDINTKEITEVLNKKIELIKKREKK